MTYADELEQVSRLKNADEKEFIKFVRDTSGMIYRITRRITANDQDAEEATQNTFLKVFRSVASFKGKSSFKTWVYRVAVNEALMRRRAASRIGRREIRSLDDDFTPQGKHRREVPDWSHHPGRDLMHDETRSLVRRAIDELPEIYRAVVILADLEELPLADISQILDLTLPAVKSRLHRARIHLRHELVRHFQENK